MDLELRGHSVRLASLLACSADRSQVTTAASPLSVQVLPCPGMSGWWRERAAGFKHSSGQRHADDYMHQTLRSAYQPNRTQASLAASLKVAEGQLVVRGMVVQQMVGQHRSIDDGQLTWLH